jgi:signal transduction histidine kinase
MRSLRVRILFLTTALLMLVLGALTLVLQIQEQLDQETRKLREVHLPAARILEQGRTELQMAQNQMRLLAQTGALQSPQAAATLEIPRAFVEWVERSDSPIDLDLDLWRKSARGYQAALQVPSDLLNLEKTLAAFLEQTELLDRAADRSVALRLLQLSETNRKHVLILSAAILAGLVAALVFLFFVWRWMSPIEAIRKWLLAATEDPLRPLPATQIGLGAPLEIENLVLALRKHLGFVRSQTQELGERSARVLENERALQVLFTALQYYIRHSEALWEELLKKERLASMGHMAAELAHEIRNPLNALSLKIELLKQDLRGTDAEAQLDALLAELDRLDALTESHLRTTRQTIRSSNEASPGTSVDETLHELCDLLKPQAQASKVSLGLSLERSESFVSLPKNVLKAALLNVMKNAVEAQTHQGGGELRVELESDSSQLRIRVLDQGPGFSNERLSDPFQSFQSTKAGGSGLGLVTTQRMLEPYGVQISLQQAERSGWGAQVEIVAPLVDSPRKEEQNLDFGRDQKGELQ